MNQRRIMTYHSIKLLVQCTTRDDYLHMLYLYVMTIAFSHCVDTPRNETAIASLRRPQVLNKFSLSLNSPLPVHCFFFFF